jgi:hypothetical protein
MAAESSARDPVTAEWLLICSAADPDRFEAYNTGAGWPWPLEDQQIYCWTLENNEGGMSGFVAAGSIFSWPVNH